MFWIPEYDQDAILNRIKACDEQAVCSAVPTTYFQVVRPDLWLADTIYVAGDLVHPPVSNGFIYECTVGGTSGSVVPGWGTSQDQTFSDNTVTWKTHINVAIANSPRVESDFTISDYSASGVTGRSIVLAEKQGIISHTAGTVSHVALVDHATKELRFVAEANTTVGAGDVESGRTLIFYELQFIVADPILLT